VKIILGPKSWTMRGFPYDVIIVSKQETLQLIFLNGLRRKRIYTKNQPLWLDARAKAIRGIREVSYLH